MFFTDADDLAGSSEEDVPYRNEKKPAAQIPKTNEKKVVVPPPAKKEKVVAAPAPKQNKKSAGAQFPWMKQKPVAAPSLPGTNQKITAASTLPMTDQKTTAAPPLPVTNQKITAASTLPMTDQKTTAAPPPPLPVTDQKITAASPLSMMNQKIAAAPSLPKMNQKIAATSITPTMNQKHAASPLAVTKNEKLAGSPSPTMNQKIPSAPQPATMNQRTAGAQIPTANQKITGAPHLALKSEKNPGAHLSTVSERSTEAQLPSANEKVAGIHPSARIETKSAAYPPTRDEENARAYLPTYNGKVAGAPGVVMVPDDPAAPSKQVSGQRQSLSDIFTIFCAGFALISDGYQNNLMTMTNVLLKQEYPKQYTSIVSTRVSNALLVGEIIGQITIGLTCDYLGRKVAIVTTTALIVIGGILATAAHGSTINGMFWMMTVARGIVGFGTGGEYPASSTSASEAANEHQLKRRGPIFILVTNLPLSFGGPLAVIVFLIVISAAGTNHLSTVWRVCFAIGCLLPLTVFYFRIKMLNSKLYRRGAIKKRVPYLLVLRYYWKSLIGTCGAWFLYDFVTFPNGVFSGRIISSVVPNGNIIKTAEYQLLLGSIALPGVFLGAYLCDILGRKQTMMLGFSGYLVFGLIIGCAYDQITKIIPLFVVFYGLMQSSGNLGPGDMLGLISSESYATAVRGTCYGISAAIGKTGAAVGTQAFTPIQTHLGKRWTFIIAAICGVVGVIVTYFFVPNLRGDDLSNEDERFRAYLVAHGWDGEMGEDDLKAMANAGIPPAVSEDAESSVVTAEKHTNMAFWTEEQKAFVIYYKSIGTPARAITSLVNTKFRLSYGENSITNLIGKIIIKEGEESRLLAIANRYPWKTVTNEERNALNKTSHGYALYNDEQRSYALYCFARGIPTKDIVTAFNQQFAMDVSFRNLKSLISRTCSKITVRDEFLRAAQNYAWFTDPVPDNHLSLSPTQHLKEGATEDSAGSTHTKPPASDPAARHPVATNSGATTPATTNPRWTTEEKAFAVYHTDRGMNTDDLLNCLNAQFHTARKKRALEGVLSFARIVKFRATQLRQYAQKCDWYTPDAAPGPPPSKRTAKAPRMRK
ncbi:MAG: hypothetical protein LQ347_006151, partial [Umbilicaria vellea]